MVLHCGNVTTEKGHGATTRFDRNKASIEHNPIAFKPGNENSRVANKVLAEMTAIRIEEAQKAMTRFGCSKEQIQARRSEIINEFQPQLINDELLLVEKRF